MTKWASWYRLIVKNCTAEGGMDDSGAMSSVPVSSISSLKCACFCAVFHYALKITSIGFHFFEPGGHVRQNHAVAFQFFADAITRQRPAEALASAEAVLPSTYHRGGYLMTTSSRGMDSYFFFSAVLSYIVSCLRSCETFFFFFPTKSAIPATVTPVTCRQWLCASVRERCCTVPATHWATRVKWRHNILQNVSVSRLCRPVFPTSGWCCDLLCAAPQHVPLAWWMRSY